MEVESPKELKGWFSAHTAEIPGSLLCDTLKRECGIIVIRKIRDELQSKMNLSDVAEPKKGLEKPRQPAAQSSQESDWKTVTYRKEKIPLHTLTLRIKEWNAPVLETGLVVANAHDVALVSKEDGQRKLATVKSQHSLAIIVEQPLNAGSGDHFQRVQFTCSDSTGQKLVPRNGFMYQLGQPPVSRVVEEGCARLKQTCETCIIVCEIEQSEAPLLWKRLRASLGKTEGDDSANRPAIKDGIRTLLLDMGLPAPADMWLRNKSLCIRANLGQGYKEALQQASKLDQASCFGLARTSRSRGVRVSKSAEAAARRLLRPDHQDDGLNVTGQWLVKNWPVGALNKEDVRQALQPSWKVRPLFSKVEGGRRTWTVAAEEGPPEPVVEIVVDAWNNTRLLEVVAKSRTLRERNTIPLQKTPADVPSPAHEVAQQTPKASTPATDPAEVLKQMHSMIAQMQLMVNTVTAMTEKPEEDEFMKPADAPTSPLRSEQQKDEEGDKANTGRASSRTPRRGSGRVWQGSPYKGGESGSEVWVAANIEACQTQLHNVIAMRQASDVLMCSEVKLTASGQKSVQQDLQNAGWQVIWGHPRPQMRRQRRQDTQWGAVNGGVALLCDLNRPAKRIPLSGDAAAYEKDGRLLLTALGYGNCKDLIYALTIYGFPGASAPGAVRNQNEQLFEAAFLALAALGDVPIVIGGDFNIDVQDSPVIASALGTGHFFDAIRWIAHSQGEEPAPTYERSKNRLDHILLNRPAMAALPTGGNVIYDHGFPTHTPVFVELKLSSFRQKCFLRQQPALIPPPPNLNSEHLDRGNRSRRMALCFGDP
eukprot:s449_g6.t1